MTVWGYTLNSWLRSKHSINLQFSIILLLSGALTVSAQQNNRSNNADALWEVFLSSKVALSDRIPLHYTGIHSADSISYAAQDTLDRVLVRDLTLCRLFNLRLPNLAPDTSRSNPFSDRTTYLDGQFDADSSFRVIMSLRAKPGAPPFWTSAYTFAEERARAAAHRVSADVIRQLTGEPTVMQTRIAYCGQIGRIKEIFSVTFDGFDRICHTRQNVSLLSPAWSPDGKKIAYTTFLEDQADIYILDLDSGTYQPFWNGPGVDQAPDWSPDGQWIAFSSSMDGNAEIYIRRVDGSELKRLTYSWAIETSPDWSPTGRQIAFTSDRLGRPQVFIMDVDGANERRLTTEGEYNDTPAWSPRGDLIAYVRRDIDGFQIYVTDPQGEKHVKLTTGPGDNMDPVWSPDGLKLAFTSNRTGRKQIYTMDLFGRQVDRISDYYMSCSNPTWSPIMDNSDDISVTRQTMNN